MKPNARPEAIEEANQKPYARPEVKETKEAKQAHNSRPEAIKEANQKPNAPAGVKERLVNDASILLPLFS